MKIFLIASLIFFQNFLTILSSDTLRPNQTFRDDGQTSLVSAGEKFELGFFSPANSNRRYIGIWLKNVPVFTVVWVANRDEPLRSSSPSGHTFAITETGNIEITGNNSLTPIWSSNSSAKIPTLKLLESGNLVVEDGDNRESYAWESFDHPCDTLLYDMKLGSNLRTGQKWLLSSWNDTDDPSTGIYTCEIDPILPQLILRKESEIQFRTGPWDGLRFGGDPPLQGNAVYKPVFVFNETDVYYTFKNNDGFTITRFWVDHYGTMDLVRWARGTGEWVSIFAVQRDECEKFLRCGPNGICTIGTNSACSCLDGFSPVAPEAWKVFIYKDGCARRTRLNCSVSIGFRKISGLKLPYSSNFTVDRLVTKREECELICRRNCSCTAYSIVGVNGCVVWFGDLLDIRVFNDGGRDLFVKMAASELGSDKDSKRTAVIISVSVVSGFLIILLLICLCVNGKRNSRSHIGLEETKYSSEDHHDPGLDDVELPSYGLHAIINATNFFSSENEIGVGGFGQVYKGILPSGQEIAVKRHSKDSNQGLDEFKNEVILISKLQHRNLVKLLGCCIHKEDRMLIYEYMSNKSLDLYLFNQTRGKSLEWHKRFSIIVGVARGLLYLHRDSRLRIIHRDLKASNILLDNEMNPKISDFGLARTFGDDQSEVNTNRVVGTYGYMSPEYAIDGHFSVKSDVFSFGVTVLEIVSGKKNRGFEHPDHDLNLLGHAWKLWNDGRPMELVDALMDNVPVSEAMKCIHISLLCVQKRPEERPLMSAALYMLEGTESEIDSLPQPNQPGFYNGRAFTAEANSSSSLQLNSNVSTEDTSLDIHGR